MKKEIIVNVERKNNLLNKLIDIVLLIIVAVNILRPSNFINNKILNIALLVIIAIIVFKHSILYNISIDRRLKNEITNNEISSNKIKKKNG